MNDARLANDLDSPSGWSPLVACRFCGRPARLWLETHDWNRGLSAQTFRYFRCSGCGLIFLSPVPGDLSRFYPREYYPLPASLAELQQAVRPERYKLELVRRFQPSGRLLEIGPSVGVFAYLAKAAGFEVDTIEVDARCCVFLRETVGVAAIESGMPSRAMGALPLYDVIALWHVIEHLSDPWETLTAVAEHLRPGGIVMIGAPNPDALQRRMLGQYWTHIDAPRHLQLIPIDELDRRARANGLRPRLLTTNTKGDYGWNQFGWQRSMSNLLRRRPFQAVAAVIGLAMTLLVLPIERTGRRGSTYTAVFEKEIR